MQETGAHTTGMPFVPAYASTGAGPIDLIIWVINIVATVFSLAGDGCLRSGRRACSRA